MVDELLVLVQAVGPVGAMALIAAWWLSQWRAAKRNHRNPSDHDLLVEIRNEMRLQRTEAMDGRKATDKRLEDIWQEVHH